MSIKDSSYLRKVASVDEHTLLRIRGAMINIRDGNRKPVLGICANLAEAISSYDRMIIGNRLGSATQLVSGLAETWPKYSGNPKYPVPRPGSNSSYEAMTVYEQTFDNKWTGEYGKLRMELLDYLIQQVDVAINLSRVLEAWPDDSNNYPQNDSPTERED